MSEFNFKSNVCTSIEQSKRLLVLGLKKETADMAITNPHFDKMFCVPIEHCLNPEHCIPAWSLHRLIELIWGDGEHNMSLETHRPFEDCIERIDYMINHSHCFNKEYLEE